MVICPKCGFEQSQENDECIRCGVIFAKLPGFQAPSAGPGAHDAGGGYPPLSGVPSRSDPADGSAVPRAADRYERDGWSSPVPSQAVPPLEAESLEVGVGDGKEPLPEVRRLDKDDLLIVAVGTAIAGLAFFIWFIKQTFLTFMILVHEMGHTIFGWLFGYPSLPAFDLRYGGGVTIWLNRSTLLLVVIYVLIGLAAFSRRRNVLTLVLLAAVGVLHAALAFTKGHGLVILFMGHGTELAIAAVFIYRGLSGAAISETVERPLYIAIGLFIVLADLSFAYRLMTSPYHRMLYQEAKGGGHWMDFSRIAEEYLHTGLPSVAGFFFLCCFMALVAGYLLFRYQEFIRAGITALWAKD